MTNKEIETLYRELCAHVTEKRLKPALDCLHTLLEIRQSGDMTDECRRLETTYQYMLQYALSGTKDKDQKKIYDQLRTDILELADRLREGIFTQNASNYLYSKKKDLGRPSLPDADEVRTRLSAENMKLLAQSLGSNREALRQRETYANRLFDLIWLNDKMTEGEAIEVSDLCTDEDIYWGEQCLLVSAVTISLLRIFDERKFLILIDAYELNPSEQVRQRAIIGFVICAYLYNSRLPLYSNLHERTLIWAKGQGVSENIQEIFLQIIRGKETEKITQKIKEVILPEMEKITPLIKQKLKLDELMNSGKPSADANPEWQEMMDKKGITDKIQELSEMQMEGSDVFLGTFKEMKSFSFFDETANWFRPFDTNSNIPDFFVGGMAESLFHSALSSPIFCDSDKYSMVIGLNHLPDDQKKAMSQSFKEEAEQLQDLRESQALPNGDTSPGIIGKQYLHNLYRFLKLGRHKEDFIDIFKLKLLLHKSFYLQELSGKENILRAMGELYFKKEFHEEAKNIFVLLLDSQPNNAELLQKCGYCLQKEGNYEEALPYYEKADTIKTGNVWTIKRIAACHRNMRHTEQALRYFREAERLNPDDLNTQLNIGHCLLEMEKYEEALNAFFKVEYLSSNNEKVWRPIAWCAFAIGKLEQAEKYATKTKEEQRDQHDWMNIGHIALCLGKIDEAVRCYSESIKKLGGDSKRFAEMLEEDKELLLKNQADENLLPLVIDQAYFKAEKKQ